MVQDSAPPAAYADAASAPQDHVAIDDVPLLRLFSELFKYCAVVQVLHRSAVMSSRWLCMCTVLYACEVVGG